MFAGKAATPLLLYPQILDEDEIIKVINGLAYLAKGQL